MKNQLVSFNKKHLFLLLILFLFSCEGGLFPVKISDLYDNTQNYDNKTIVVKGRVSSSFSFLGFSAYTIDDGTGELIVLGDDRSPSPDSEIKVKGKLKAPARFHDEVFLVLKVTKEKSK